MIFLHFQSQNGLRLGLKTARGIVDLQAAAAAPETAQLRRAAAEDHRPADRGGGRVPGVRELLPGGDDHHHGARCG